jgi:hypothetical protein
MSDDDDEDNNQEEEEDEEGGKPRKQVFAPGRLKRMIQADDSVGKIAKGSLLVVGRATELFLIELAAALAKETTSNKRKKVALKDVQAGWHTPWCLADACHSLSSRTVLAQQEKYDFLRNLVDDAETPATKPKRAKSEPIGRYTPIHTAACAQHHSHTPAARPTHTQSSASSLLF